MLVQKSDVDRITYSYNHDDHNNIIATAFKTSIDKANDEKNRHILKQKHFLLCPSCFWCASSIFSNTMDWICPVCNNNCKVESIPIRNI